jgi:hypothetical protein
MMKRDTSLAAADPLPPCKGKLHVGSAQIDHICGPRPKPAEPRWSAQQVLLS